MNKFVETILMIFIVIPFLFIEQGWAISTLWSWFVVPLGVPEIGIATAIGFTLVAGVIRMRGGTRKDRKPGERKEFLISVALTPLVGVAIGWIVLQFV